MELDLADYPALAKRAVKDFWTGRGAARSRQLAGDLPDRGERASVVGGKNMDGFVSLVSALAAANGLADAEVCRQKRLLTLPGYFRPTKLWDVLVVRQGRLIAAIEFKSHIGPSFGNNFNNRAEEAIGTATDLWIAHRNGAFGGGPAPFVGWLMLLEDCPESRASVQTPSQHFPVRPEFANASYALRYDLLCRRLMQERLYTAAAVLQSPRTAVRTGAFSGISDDTGLRSFVAALAGQFAAEAVRGRQ
jgi:hypothetical protein